MEEETRKEPAATAVGAPRSRFRWPDLIAAGLIFVVSQVAAGWLYVRLGGEVPDGSGDADAAAFLQGRYVAAVYFMGMTLCLLLLWGYHKLCGWHTVFVFRAPGWASPIRLLWGYMLMWCFSVAVEPIAAMLPNERAALGGGGWLLVSSVVMAPVFEEMIFRGFLTGAMRRAYGGLAAWICPALVFGLVHMAPAAMITAAAGGLVLGFYYLRYRSLVLVIMLHAMNNATACFLAVIGLGGKRLGDVVTDPAACGAAYAVCAGVTLVALGRMFQVTRRMKREDCPPQA